MGNHGEFQEGDEVPITRWLRDDNGKDKHMRLHCDFTYTDPDKTPWLAEEGDEISGANIPEFLWGRRYGSPYVGDFRRAAVIHDCYYPLPDREPRNIERKNVDKMFYHAMRCDGVDWYTAAKMYWAVRLLGRWDTDPDDKPKPDWGPISRL